MVQQLELYCNETELKIKQDSLYSRAKDGSNNFRNLLESIVSRTNIDTAIHNMKSNTGSKTPGVDGKTINDVLTMDREKVYEKILNMCNNYKASKIRRVFIPKGDDPKGRQLGIPTIWDRILQECIRNILEPIFEAKFFEHSYGFRPMREGSMALARIENIARTTECKWVVEGDISKFFDNINHKILLKLLIKNGIKDRRVLMIIKEMLKAGIEGESEITRKGTPQGGILSPLLANIYLNEFDQWISKQWENKEIVCKKRPMIGKPYSKKGNRIEALKKSNMKQAYLIRYADDWVLLTDSKENALFWLNKCAEFMDKRLDLELSRTKTCITNICKKNVKFLNIDIKLFKRKGNWYCRTRPNEEKLVKKISSIQKSMSSISRASDLDNAIHELNIVNSKIRGLINYYECCSEVNKTLTKYSNSIDFTGLRAIKRWNSGRIEAKKCNNLLDVHKGHNWKIPFIRYKASEDSDEMIIGLTNLGFCKHKYKIPKNQNETPYSNEGRKLYRARTKKNGLLARADDILSTQHSLGITINKHNFYNYEYYLNRAYAFNRDKGKCRKCKCDLNRNNVEVHHKDSKLPIDKINKVSNLITLCRDCHTALHNNLS